MTVSGDTISDEETSYKKSYTKINLTQWQIIFIPFLIEHCNLLDSLFLLFDDGNATDRKVEPIQYQEREKMFLICILFHV